MINIDFKAIFLLAVIAIGSIGACDAVDFRYENDGTSHWFTTHITGPGLDEQFSDKVECTKKTTHDLPLVLNNPYHITINSKAWRDYGWCHYRWEETGTTKSWDFVYDESHVPAGSHRYYVVTTPGDTVFNGGHLKFKEKP